MERTGPQVHVAPTRCPYCHEGIPRGEQPVVCPDCHALHHAACLDEAGACAACGRRTSSPEDSKLAAALRARASARVAKGSEAEATSGGRREVDRRSLAVLALTAILALAVGGLAGFLRLDDIAAAIAVLVLFVAALGRRATSRSRSERR